MSPGIEATVEALNDLRASLPQAALTTAEAAKVSELCGEIGFVLLGSLCRPPEMPTSSFQSPR